MTQLTAKSTIELNTIQIANDKLFVLFGGMNVLESCDLAFEIAETYDYLLIEKSDVICSVLTFAKTNSYDLSDLLIGAIAKANECSTTLTFDKKASKSPAFELLT